MSVCLFVPFVSNLSIKRMATSLILFRPDMHRRPHRFPVEHADCNDRDEHTEHAEHNGHVHHCPDFQTCSLMLVYISGSHVLYKYCATGLVCS